MVLALWVAVGTVAAWVVFWQVIIVRCLVELRNQTLKLESVDCETDNRLFRLENRLEATELRFKELFEAVDRLMKVDLKPLNREFRDRIDRLSGVMSDHKNEMKGHVGVLRDHIEVCKEKIDSLKNDGSVDEAADSMLADRIASIAKNLDYLSDRVVALESGGIVFGPPITNSPVPRGVEVAKGTCSPMSEQEVAAWQEAIGQQHGKVSPVYVHETTPDSHEPLYEVDWGKSEVKFKPFSVLNTAKGESQTVTAGFDSKLVSRMDELQPKVTSAGDDLRAAEVLPGSPAAKVGSQANHSSDLLRMFNAPPIICARGAMLVERKGV